MALVVTATATATVVTVTLTGTVGAAVSLRLSTPAGAEEDTGSRTGDGTVSLTPSSAGRKFVTAWITAGGGAASCEVVVPSTAAPTVAWYRVVRIDRVPGEPYKRLRVERIEKPVEP